MEGGEQLVPTDAVTPPLSSDVQRPSEGSERARVAGGHHEIAPLGVGQQRIASKASPRINIDALVTATKRSTLSIDIVHTLSSEAAPQKFDHQGILLSSAKKPYVLPGHTSASSLERQRSAQC